jgi:hypothetical protein
VDGYDSADASVNCECKSREEGNQMIAKDWEIETYAFLLAPAEVVLVPFHKVRVNAHFLVIKQERERKTTKKRSDLSLWSRDFPKLR